jgi:hypothetical protein
MKKIVIALSLVTSTMLLANSKYISRDYLESHEKELKLGGKKYERQDIAKDKEKKRLIIYNGIAYYSTTPKLTKSLTDLLLEPKVKPSKKKRSKKLVKKRVKKKIKHTSKKSKKRPSKKHQAIWKTDKILEEAIKKYKGVKPKERISFKPESSNGFHNKRRVKSKKRHIKRKGRNYGEIIRATPDNLRKYASYDNMKPLIRNIKYSNMLFGDLKALKVSRNTEENYLPTKKHYQPPQNSNYYEAPDDSQIPKQYISNEISYLDLLYGRNYTDSSSDYENSYFAGIMYQFPISIESDIRILYKHQYEINYSNNQTEEKTNINNITLSWIYNFKNAISPIFTPYVDIGIGFEHFAKKVFANDKNGVLVKGGVGLMATMGEYNIFMQYDIKNRTSVNDTNGELFIGIGRTFDQHTKQKRVKVIKKIYGGY